MKQHMYELPFFSHDPHGFLGIHPIEGGKIIRLWNPHLQEVWVEFRGEEVLVPKGNVSGLFFLEVPEDVFRGDYRVRHTNGVVDLDPYTFTPTFGELDGYLFSKGVHYQLYEVLGAHYRQVDGCYGVSFAVWAPCATAVFLIGDFNHWHDRRHPMRSMGASGVWELFIPGLQEGERYKFAVLGKDGKTRFKSDPFATYGELRPNNASRVWNLDKHVWKDADWMQERVLGDTDRPLNVYEVHLGSWKKEGEFPQYRQIAHELAAYVKEMGFTHIELMPLAEHPLDESWGYQVSGFYAVTSRFGTPDDFQYFVDHMHQQGIGVILDWVAAHFPLDDFSLSCFDGTALYEHSDPKLGFHPHWNTHIFNYGRFEVSNFLIANALFWLDKMHIDGLRVDAVASMIYLDYGRQAGEWIANCYGGNENLEALEFLKHMNSIVHEKFPKVLMIAEESTAFPGVSHPLAWGGLGFDLKWNMGWMNDTLRYFKQDPLFRCHDHQALTFGLLYAFSERFVLALSHDEVVHGKASLLSKMPGDEWQKFANLRLLYSYMICQPGKKLLFMGGELGQWREWNCKESLDWFLLEFAFHAGMQRCVRDLNRLYKQHPALWQSDFEARGFEWIDFSDHQNSIISYLRKGKDEVLLCIHNFTPQYFEQYNLYIRDVKGLQELFSTDRREYEGSGQNAHIWQLQYEKITLSIPPLATVIFQVQY